MDRRPSDRTEFLFRRDSYLKTVSAKILDADIAGGIVLDRTNFYAASGGQPGDSGHLETVSGDRIRIVDTVHPLGRKDEIIHIPAEQPNRLKVDDEVVCHIDWTMRYKLMRMHTALHLLSVVLPFPVTGGSIGAEKGRLDFQMPEPPNDKDALTERLNNLIDRELDVSEEWITEAELEANPTLVKTMSVMPPSGQGKIRMIRIHQGTDTVDWQPCGGTHVANTREIGRIRLAKVEKKGKINRRFILSWQEESASGH